MTDKQTIFVLLTSLSSLLFIIILIHKHQFREKYAILWVGVSLLFLSVLPFRNFYLKLAGFFGIINPITFFFFMAIMALFALSVQFTVALTTAFYQRKAAIQHMASLEERYKRLVERVEWLERERELGARRGDDI